MQADRTEVQLVFSRRAAPHWWSSSSEKSIKSENDEAGGRELEGVAANYLYEIHQHFPARGPEDIHSGGHRFADGPSGRTYSDTAVGEYRQPQETRRLPQEAFYQGKKVGELGRLLPFLRAREDQVGQHRYVFTKLTN